MKDTVIRVSVRAVAIIVWVGTVAAWVCWIVPVPARWAASGLNVLSMSINSVAFAIALPLVAGPSGRKDPMIPRLTADRAEGILAKIVDYEPELREAGASSDAIGQVADALRAYRDGDIVAPRKKKTP